MTASERYDLFGWDYQAINPLGAEEVAWHIGWARQTGGPLLGLACGTGRLLCHMAEAGFDVTGVDLSEKMLDMARQNVAAMPADARARIHLVKGDMSGFDLDRRFGMVFIADNSFRELSSRRQLLACLRCIRRHLAPDGKLLITERRFNPSLFPNGRRSFGWSDPRPHPETGHMVSRRGEFRLSRDGRYMRGKFLYKTILPGGKELFQTCPVSAPILNTPEYMDLFHNAGFDAQALCGYKQVPEDGIAPILSFVCRQKKPGGIQKEKELP
jgi:SAM-dependent methyltransferase